MADPKREEKVELGQASPVGGQEQEGGARPDAVAVQSHLRHRKEHADAYHEKHAHLVAQFRAAAGNVCDGEGGGGINFFKVKNFQVKHDLVEDGKIGEHTLHAAQPKAEKPVEKKKEPEKEPEKEKKAAPRDEQAVAPEKPKVDAPPVVAPANQAVGAHAVVPQGAEEAKSGKDVNSSRGGREHFVHRPESGYRKTYSFDGHDVMVFLPPAGIEPPDVEVFLFFHGLEADYALNGGKTIEREVKQKDGSMGKEKAHLENPAEKAHMAEAVAGSKRNVVAIVPEMKADEHGKGAGWAGKDASWYKKLTNEVLAKVGGDLGKIQLKMSHMSIAGHSAGGMALGAAAEAGGDLVNDVTLQDAGYGWGAYQASFSKLLDWLLKSKSGGKTIRVLTRNQIGSGGAVDSTRNLVERKKGGYNAESINAHIQEIGLSGLVAKDLFEGQHDGAQRQDDMQLEHKIEIAGNGQSQGTISVFGLQYHKDKHNKPDIQHLDVRDDTMAAVIAAGAQGEKGDDFARKDRKPGAGVAEGKQAAPAESKHGGDAPMPSKAHRPDAQALARELMQIMLWEAAIAFGGGHPGEEHHEKKDDHAKKVAEAQKVKNDFDGAGGKEPDHKDKHKDDHPAKPGGAGTAKKTKNAKELVEVYGNPAQVQTAGVTAYFGGPDKKPKHKAKDKDHDKAKDKEKADEKPKEETPHSGNVPMHALIAPILQNVFNQIRDSPNKDWKHIVQKPGGYVPRPMRPDPTHWSTHAWGIAVDINEDTNRYGAKESEDQKVIHHYFTDAGFDWLSWDPMHFQYHDKSGSSVAVNDADVQSVKAGKTKIDGGESLKQMISRKLKELNAKKTLKPYEEKMKTRLEEMQKTLDG